VTGKTEQKNPFVRHQYGFAIGGPIKKDKTFYFVNGEFNHFLTTLTNVSVVPTAAAKTGVFNFTDSNGFTQPIDLRPGSPNNIISTLFAGAPPMVEDPTSAKIFALMPDPNGPSVDSIRGKYFFPSSSITD